MRTEPSSPCPSTIGKIRRRLNLFFPIFHQRQSVALLPGKILTIRFELVEPQELARGVKMVLNYFEARLVDGSDLRNTLISDHCQKTVGFQVHVIEEVRAVARNQNLCVRRSLAERIHQDTGRCGM